MRDNEDQQDRRRKLAVMLPIEWRERMRSCADAGEPLYPTEDAGTRVLNWRTRLKPAHKRSSGRSEANSRSQAFASRGARTQTTSACLSRRTRSATTS